MGRRSNPKIWLPFSMDRLIQKIRREPASKGYDIVELRVLKTFSKRKERQWYADDAFTRT